MRLDHCLEGRPRRASHPRLTDIITSVVYRVIAVMIAGTIGPIARHSSLRRASARCRPSRRQSPNAMQTRGAGHGNKAGANAFTATGSWRVHRG